MIFITHVLKDSIIDRFKKISYGFKNYGDAILVFIGEQSLVKDLKDEIKFETFDNGDFISLPYIPLCERIVPGSNHFVLLWCYNKFPKYRYYWNIEYDVYYTGDWNYFFNQMSKRKSDFLSSHIETYKQNPSWYWWNVYQCPHLDIYLKNRIRSFNPIFRISNDAIKSLDEFLKRGNYGHHEVVIPTYLYFSNYDIEDFGGCGKFVKESFENLVYVINEETSTMRYRPLFNSILEMSIPNKLYHPYKK